MAGRPSERKEIMPNFWTGHGPGLPQHSSACGIAIGRDGHKKTRTKHQNPNTPKSNKSKTILVRKFDKLNLC
jgi:hypothetical protein